MVYGQSRCNVHYLVRLKERAPTRGCTSQLQPLYSTQYKTRGGLDPLQQKWICRHDKQDHWLWWLGPSSLFKILDSNWGPHSVDCFSSPHNKQIHSWFLSPGCEALDVNWGSELNWWVPPLHLVCHAISHACNCNAKGTCMEVCPILACSSSWWPAFSTFQAFSTFNPFVLD